MQASHILLFLLSFSHFIQRPYRNELMSSLNPDNLSSVMTGTLFASILIIGIVYWAERAFSAKSVLTIVLAAAVMVYVYIYMVPTQTFESTYLYLILNNAINLSIISISWFLVLSSSASIEYSTISGLSITCQVAALAGSIGALIVSNIVNPSTAILASILCLILSLPALGKIKNIAAFQNLNHGFSSETTKVSFYVIVYTILSTGLYYFMLKKISQELGYASARIDALSIMDISIHAITLILSFALSKVTITLKTSFTLLPILSFIPLAWINISSSAIVCIVSFISFKCIHYAISRPNREAYLVQKAKKEGMSSKILADSFSYRLGDVIGGWLITLFIFFDLDVSAMALCFIPFAILWLLTGKLLTVKFI